MTLRKQVKYNAKRCLCNSWGKAVAISLMGVAIYLLFAIIEMIANLLLTLPAQTSYLIPGISDSWLLSFAISVVMAIGSFLLLVPLNLGITSWYYSLSDGISEDILNIFCFFANRRMFFRSLYLTLNIGVRVLLTSLLYLIVPGAGIGFSIWLLSTVPFAGAIFAGSLALTFSAMLFLLMLGFLLVRLQKYFLARYYLLDTTTTVHKAIRNSIHATKSVRDEIFLFKLSFLGWGIASLILLPILYTSAYYSMSAMLYARFLMEQDKRSNSIVLVGDVNSDDGIEEGSTAAEDLSQTKPFESCSPSPAANSDVSVEEPTISVSLNQEQGEKE